METASQVLKAGVPSFAAARNACKLCAPLGACWAFKGVEGAVPLIHGSQGCATYIRRYLISHFREPVDIASSSFGESSAIFGGGANLSAALDNVVRQYHPELIGVASTCLSETIGDDVPRIVRHWAENSSSSAKDLSVVTVSTPSYSGTHAEGFHAAVRALTAALAREGPRGEHVNLLPGMLSPDDLRHLKEIVAMFGLEAVLLPDYSETLDAPTQAEFDRIPHGGTPLKAIRSMGQATATLEFGRTLAQSENTAGRWLEKELRVPRCALGIPLGIRETDAFFRELEKISGRPTPLEFARERGRLIDAYVDGHRYLFGQRAIVYGEEDLVVGIVAFLSEIGVVPVLCASGGESGQLSQQIHAVLADGASPVTVREGADFAEIEEEAAQLAPDLIIGNSKGQSLACKLKVPLVWLGFPIHDRFGAQRILHVGYRGTQQLFDRVVNALLQHKQAASSVGYSYL